MANPDVDGDGHASLACGGDDCDDANPGIHPGASEGALAAVSLPSIPGYEGMDLDARTDATGATHVAFNWRASNNTQERLRYLKITAAGTAVDAHEVHNDTSTIASQVGRGISVAVDSLSRPHVTFFDQRNTGAVTFFHGLRDSGSWALASPDADQHTAVAIGAGDVVHAVTSGLRYVTDESGAFVATDLAPGYAPAIAIAPDNTVHVAFSSTNGVRHATKTGAAWSVESIEDFASTGFDPGVQLAFDSAGVAHVVYRSGLGNRHARLDNSEWTIETIGEGGIVGPRSLIALPDGRLGTAYIDWLPDRGNTLMLAFRDAGGWHITDTIACGCGDAALVTRGDELGVVFEAGGNLLLGTFGAPDGVDNDCDGTAW